MGTEVKRPRQFDQCSHADQIFNGQQQQDSNRCLFLFELMLHLPRFIDSHRFCYYHLAKVPRQKRAPCLFVNGRNSKQYTLYIRHQELYDSATFNRK
jgi:hypothetical protein